MIEWKCWFFHDWTKWETQIGKIMHNGKFVNNSLEIRKCQRCGKVQREWA